MGIFCNIYFQQVATLPDKRETFEVLSIFHMSFIEQCYQVKKEAVHN